MALPPIYDPEAVKPMWQDLAAIGVEPLTTPQAVDAAVQAPGTCLVIVNSVCGCAAGHARPGAMLALQHGLIPDRFVTVFAGVDRDAVERAREHMAGYAPSSPSIGLFKDGQQVYMLERRQIEQMDDQMVASALTAAFDAHCGRKGPSVDAETFRQIVPFQACGSSIPRTEGRRLM